MRQCARCRQDCRGKKGLETHDKVCKAPKDGVVISKPTTVAPPIPVVFIPESRSMEDDSEGPPEPAGMRISATGVFDAQANEYVYTVWDTHSAEVHSVGDGGSRSIPPVKLSAPRTLGVVRRAAGVGAAFGPIELRDAGWSKTGEAGRLVKCWSLR